MTSLRRRTDLGDEDHVFAAELLFQLSDQTDLDFLEGLELRDRDKDNDGFSASTNFDLLKKTSAFVLKHRTVFTSETEPHLC